MKVIKEHFNSISEMTDIIMSRPNNEIMKDRHSSSKEGDEGWYGTKSLDESIHLMRTGYTDILPMVKEGLSQSIKVLSKQFAQYDAKRPTNLPVGFIPNVPNTILGLPDAMINIKLNPQKRKTLTIIYIMSGSAGCNIDMWIKAGISLLTAIKIIERAGISTKIDASFYCGSDGNKEAVMGSVTVKHFGQPLDLQKLTFPLANPSMFRRVGFKFLETTPILKNDHFSFGYGKCFNLYAKEIKKELETPNIYVLSGQWIEGHDYSVKEILDYLNFSKKQ